MSKKDYDAIIKLIGETNSKVVRLEEKVLTHDKALEKISSLERTVQSFTESIDQKLNRLLDKHETTSTESYREIGQAIEEKISEIKSEKENFIFEVIRETNNQRIREKRAVVFGYEQSQSDEQILKEIAEKKKIDCTDITKTFRYEQTVHMISPMVLVFDSKTKRDKFVINGKRAKDKPSKLVINFDLTKAQRKEYKTLLEKCKEQNKELANGITHHFEVIDFKIVKRKGIYTQNQ